MVEGLMVEGEMFVLIVIIFVIFVAIEGLPFLRTLHEEPQRSSPCAAFRRAVSYTFCFRCCRCLCLCRVQHLHDNNIIYRDIKPENILLDADGHIKVRSIAADAKQSKKWCTTLTAAPCPLLPIWRAMPF